MKRSTLSILLILLSTNVAAADDNLQMSGFISQSLVKTSHGVKLSGNSDGKYGSIERTELGGLIAWQANEHVDFRGMASFIKDGHATDHARVNYALVDIHTSSGLDGVRLGRYSYDYGFYNAARNNPTYRDMELPPQGLYRDGFRYMTRSGDGIQVYTKSHLTDNFSAEVEIGYGTPTIYPQEEIVQTFVMDKSAGEFTNDSKFRSFNLTIDNRQHGVTLKYGYLLMDYQFSTKYIDGGAPFSMRPENHYIGIRKYFSFGDVTAEMMKTNMGTTKWDSLNPMPNYVWGGVEGWTITYKHYLTDSTSALVGYDQWLVNKDDSTGTGIEHESYGNIPHAAMYHKSWNVGLIHHTGNYTLKGEAHFVKGSNTVRAEGNDILNKGQPDNYNIFILTATYKF